MNSDFETSMVGWEGLKLSGPSVVVAPEFLSRDTDTPNGSAGSLRVSLSKQSGFEYWTHIAGASCTLNTMVSAGTTLRISFYAKRISGATLLNIYRRSGGAELPIRIPLTDRWERYQVNLRFHQDGQHLNFSLVPADVGNIQMMEDGVFLLDDVQITVAQPHAPSVLFASPRGVDYGYINYDYLERLKAAGFEVDFTNNITEVSWERLRQYDAVVLYMTPETAEKIVGDKPATGQNQAFVEAVERFVAMGGGVFLFPREHNYGKQSLADFTTRWGAMQPIERIEESRADRRGQLSNASWPIPLYWTNRVYDTPVSSAGMQLWYPVHNVYNTSLTTPIEVDGNWTVVASASDSASTVALDLAAMGSSRPIPDYQRPSGVVAPDLMAIRSYRGGRVALISQWSQFTFGAGTQEFYNYEVLERGVNGRPSQWGTVLDNTLRWLTSRSLEVGGVGGYVTPAGRLDPPNLTPAVKAEYTAKPTWPELKASWSAPPEYGAVRRGLIGAKSNYGSGASSVSEYAAAARSAGLSFVVFADDFDSLTSAELASLTAECEQNSDSDLLLLPGFSIRTDADNYAFFYGKSVSFPAPEMLSGTRLKLNGGGSYNYMLSYSAGANAGFYNFVGSGPGAMKVSDLRNYGAVAVRYYRNGALQEDVTSGYLLSAEINSASAMPVCFNEVRTAAELTREVTLGNALTYARASSASNILSEALGWVTYASATSTFVSDGPAIHRWSSHDRDYTYASEDFVTTRALNSARLEISSPNGLAMFELYDGKEIYWRQTLNGELRYSTTLQLERTLEKNLVLVVTDRQNKKAISHARMMYKEGSDAVTFCTDRANDCKAGMLLARGPVGVPVQKIVPLPYSIAGATWDGAPNANITTIHGIESRPHVRSNLGAEYAINFNQTPVLDFADEGATAVSSEQNELFAPGVPIINTWATYGPLAGPSQLFAATIRYRELLPPVTGVPELGWVAFGERSGTTSNLFRSEITFKRSQTLSEVQIADLTLNETFSGKSIAYKRVADSAPVVVDLASSAGNRSVRLAVGDWFAIYGASRSSSSIFIVRSRPVQLVIAAPSRVYVRADPSESASVTAGQKRTWELFSLGVPMDVPIRSANDAATRVSYLRTPSGLSHSRGTRNTNSPGLLEYAASDFAARVKVERPTVANGLSLPLRVTGLNPNWTAGVWQISGYTLGHHHPSGANLYRETGVDRDPDSTLPRGSAYVPLHVNLAATTEVFVGHPISADSAGENLLIRVTRLYDSATEPHWYIAVSNPTGAAITTRLTQRLSGLPGLNFSSRTITVPARSATVLRAE